MALPPHICVCRAEHSYEACTDDEVTLQQGALVLVDGTRFAPDGWSYAEAASLLKTREQFRDKWSQTDPLVCFTQL